MRHALFTVSLLGLIIARPVPLHGEDGFRLPTFSNPFRGRPVDEEEQISARVSDEVERVEEEGFSFPQVTMPKWELPDWQLPRMEMPAWARRQPGEPSAWERLNRSTKNLFTKTRDTLMPWATPEKPALSSGVTGSRSRAGSNVGRESSARGVETTNDFLSLPRPQFD